ncbi:hypothetical protein Rsub_10085 [Raphidocelis subcapitata]|uniref:F-box domain-containing protein n=1 Tax=Raphidocelis subcapitata TaxID=307507 RepID=A0A2V0PBI7_9CHLO|nr:hypothetical protein Rsub_10085 [Raphidocelis subcapitata]|eukprot:GBF97224.1 hypothetical protein Rsub_10085 [Raphidocelis subcapitata]
MGRSPAARGRGRGRGGAPASGRGQQRRGLLGAFVAGSSDDEDYRPDEGDEEGGQPVRARVPRGRAGRGDARSGQQRAPPQRRRAAAAPAPAGGADSDGSGETLGARRQRIAEQLRAGGAALAPTAAAAAAAAAAAGPSAAAGAVASDGLPLPVLSKIFSLACAAGALPTACRLARVCRGWRDAVAASPEVWRVVDARGRRSKKADAWLQQQAAAGRFSQLEDLTIGQLAVGGGADEEEDEAVAAAADAAAASGRGDAGTSAEALAALVRNCLRLRRLVVTGSPSIRAGLLEAALLEASGLEELHLREVRLQPLSGLEKALQALLASAWGGARPLRVLEARRCPLLGNKTLRMLYHGPAAAAEEPAQLQPQLQPAAADGDPPAPAPAGPPAAAASAVAAAAAAGPSAPPAVGYPHLTVLDLTGSCVSPGLIINVEELQAACPNLEVLSLEGVGALYGWTPTRARPGAPRGPGWPRLRALRAGALLQRVQGGAAARMTRSALDDALLVRLAAGSHALAELGLRGSAVSASGLSSLIAGAGGAAAAAAAAAPPAREHAAGPSVVQGCNQQQQPQQQAQQAEPQIATLEITSSALCCDEGLWAIGDAFAASLRVLEAGRAGAAVSDDGLEGLHGCGALRALDVSGSSVTDDGLRRLLASPAGASLSLIDVTSCRSLSRAARQAALEGLPALRAALGLGAGA